MNYFSIVLLNVQRNVNVILFRYRFKLSIQNLYVLCNVAARG
jgi:hypothetical protein